MMQGGGTWISFQYLNCILLQLHTTKTFLRVNRRALNKPVELQHKSLQNGFLAFRIHSRRFGLIVRQEHPGVRRQLAPNECRNRIRSLDKSSRKRIRGWEV